MWGPYTHTPLPGHACDDGILSVPAEMQHHLNQENSSCLKAALMEKQENVTIQTSLKLSCTSGQSYPPPHTHEASSAGDYYTIGL